MNLFENLKAGDKIGIIPATSTTDPVPFESHWNIHEVTCTTKTLIFVGDRRFKKKGGGERGGQSTGYFSASLVCLEDAKAHNAKIAKINAKRKLTKQVKSVNFEKLTAEQLMKIMEIVEKV